MFSVPIFLDVLLIVFSQQVSGKLCENGFPKDLDVYLDNFKAELERQYEAKLHVLKGEFKDEIKALKEEFHIKEDEYRSRIELLERIVSSNHVPQAEVEDVVTLHEPERPVMNDNKYGDDIGSKNGRSKSGINKRQLSPEAENRVAFYASVSKEVRHMGANQDIVFDKVVTNLGYAYNGHHGTFIAPVAGTYVFFTTLHASGTETWGHFMVNGAILAKIHLKGVQSSQTVIAHLNKGDDVSIQNTALDKGLHGDMYSTFGGFLLFEDTGFGTEIIGK